MKRKFFKVASVAAITVVCGINVFNAQKSEALSDVALANVEALAQGETGKGNCSRAKLVVSCYRGNTWVGPRWFDVWGLPVKRRLRTCSEEERGRIAHNAHQVLDRCCHAVTADK